MRRTRLHKSRSFMGLEELRAVCVSFFVPVAMAMEALCHPHPCSALQTAPDHDSKQWLPDGVSPQGLLPPWHSLSALGYLSFFLPSVRNILPHICCSQKFVAIVGKLACCDQDFGEEKHSIRSRQHVQMDKEVEQSKFRSAVHEY